MRPVVRTKAQDAATHGSIRRISPLSMHLMMMSLRATNVLAEQIGGSLQEKTPCASHRGWSEWSSALAR